MPGCALLTAVQGPRLSALLAWTTTRLGTQPVLGLEIRAEHNHLERSISMKLYMYVGAALNRV